MRAAEPFAYGELGLLPWEFVRLTPREYRLKTQAFERQEQRTWQLLGTLALHVMAPHWNKKKYGPLTMKHAVGFFPNPARYLKRD